MKNLNVLDISFYQVKLFLVLAEELNFSRAAVILNVAQPTISKRISVIENNLGITLFDRNKRPLELTRAGKVLFDEWRRLIKNLERSIERAKEQEYKANKDLTICTLDTGKRLPEIKKATRYLEEKFEGLNITETFCASGDWRKNLVTKTIDVMVTLLLEDSFVDKREFESVRIMTCPKLVCMLKTNPLSQKTEITIEDLKDQQFIVNSLQTLPAHYEFIRRICLEHGFEPRVSRYVDSAHSLIWYLKKDSEVVICDKFLRDAQDPQIKQFALPNVDGGLLAVWHKSNTNPWIAEYIEAIKMAFRDEL